jgi:hypothetical protein
MFLLYGFTHLYMAPCQAWYYTLYLCPFHKECDLKITFWISTVEVCILGSVELCQMVHAGSLDFEML